MEVALGATALTPRDTDLTPVLGPGLHPHGLPILSAYGPWVEVADRALVPRARWPVWSRELALTSLVARRGVSPFGRLLSLSHSRAHGPGSLPYPRRGGPHDPPHPEKLPHACSACRAPARGQPARRRHRCA